MKVNYHVCGSTNAAWPFSSKARQSLAPANITSSFQYITQEMEELGLLLQLLLHHGTSHHN
jgi:hypothetical protein